MKKVLVQFNIPGLTQATYDNVWTDLRTSGNGNPKGLLFHWGGQQGDNWVVTDVWESQEAFGKFGEVLGPLFAKYNVAKVDPVITPVHYEYVGTPSGTPR